MATKNLVDARGRSCPEPVLMTQRAIENEGFQNFEVLVDAVVAKENIKRFVQKKGFSLEVEELNGEFILKIRK